MSGMSYKGKIFKVQFPSNEVFSPIILVPFVSFVLIREIVFNGIRPESGAIRDS